MKRVIAFLDELSEHNNRPWFQEHKEQYKQAQSVMDDLSLRLIAGVQKFDPTTKGLGLKDCTYRIYRDIRFSKDKRPYKTHMGCFVCPGGKRSGHAGYYFHVEARGSHYLGHHLICAGAYNPTSAELKSVREDLCYSHREFARAIAAAPHFSLDMSDTLRRVPSGYPADQPYSEALKLKNYLIGCHITEDFVLSDTVVDKVLELFRETLDFTRYINRAIDYAHEEAGIRY